MPMRILWPCRLVLQAVIQNLGKRIGLDEALPPGVPLGQNFFLLELVESFALLDAGLNRG